MIARTNRAIQKFYIFFIVYLTGSTPLSGTFFVSIRHFLAMISVSAIIRLSPIDIDAQIHFAADKFRFPQTSGFYFSNNSRNPASPVFN